MPHAGPASGPDEPDHPGLTEQDVLTRGGWNPRYARVLAVASDGDYGFAVTDGNGDGAELEEEMWQWDSGHWEPGASSGGGHLDNLGPERTGGFIAEVAYFACGSAPGRSSITIEFDGQMYQAPVGKYEVWAFIKVRTDPSRGFPSRAD
jgi:hypothetical protein